jgi:hypothetical protein
MVCHRDLGDRLWEMECDPWMMRPMMLWKQAEILPGRQAMGGANLAVTAAAKLVEKQLVTQDVKHENQVMELGAQKN